MLIFMDGFDHYAPVGTKGAIIQKYLNAAGYDIRNPTNDTFSVIEGRRPDACALRFTVTSGASINASLSWGFPSVEDIVVFGFAFRASGTRMRVCRIENIVDIEWSQETGKLMIEEEEGVDPLIMNAWYYFEVEIDKVLKVVNVYVNDELQISSGWSGIAPEKYTVVWGQTSRLEVDGSQDIDDLYVLDSSPGENTERLKPCEVATRAPSADILTEWAIVGSEEEEHWKVASQTLALEVGAPHLQSNIEGKEDRFRSNAVLPSNNAIFGVALSALARKGDLDYRSIGLNLSVGGQSVEEQMPLTEAYKYHQVIHEKTPSGGAWNQNAVESSEFGIVTR